MNFLFSTTIHLDGEVKCTYKVFRFKLEPIKYKAELIEGKCPPDILLWKENNSWATRRQTKEIRLLASILGQEINKWTN